MNHETGKNLGGIGAILLAIGFLGSIGTACMPSIDPSQHLTM